MPELGPYGSVRGARGNSRPYRESQILGSSGPLMIQKSPKSAMPELHSKHAGTVQKARMAVTSAASKEANATTVACLGCRDHAID